MSSDQLYSWALLASLVCGTVAVVAALLGRRRPHAGWARLARRASGAGALCLLVSVATHLGWGHRPGGPEALPLLAFVRTHPAFLVAAALSGIALFSTRRSKRRNRESAAGEAREG
jgi:hypothetical protein